MKVFDYLGTIISFLPIFDMFGRRVQLSVDQKPGVKSKIGGAFSLFLIGVALFSFVNNYLLWINGDQLHMISSYNSLTVEDTAKKTPKLIYEFNSSNYYIYFSLSSSLDSKYIYNEDLKRYLNYSMNYYSLDSDYAIPIELEFCSDRKMNEFLELDQNFLNDDSVNRGRICIKDGQNIKMGYSYEELGLGFAHLEFNIERCINSTENNFTCASREEIDAVIDFGYIQVSLPKTFYDFNNPANCRKRSFQYKIYALDPGFFHYYDVSLIPNYLLTDHGIINSDYKLDSVDFNPESFNYQAFSEELNDGILFQYNIAFDFNQQFYYRKNENVFWLFSSLGGTLNFFFIFGNMIIYFYNSLLLKHQLINISFSHDDTVDNKKTTYTQENIGLKDKQKEEPNPKFSIFQMICPTFYKNTGYYESLKNIQEYLDIRNIIRRFQEIDKLKLLLFDEKELQEFDNLPKPTAKYIKKNKQLKVSHQRISEALEKSTYLKKNRFSMNYILSSTNIRTKGLLQIDEENNKNLHVIDLEKNIKEETASQREMIFHEDEKKDFIKENEVPEENFMKVIEMKNLSPKNKIDIEINKK